MKRAKKTEVKTTSKGKGFSVKVKVSRSSKITDEEEMRRHVGLVRKQKMVQLTKKDKLRSRKTKHKLKAYD